MAAALADCGGGQGTGSAISAPPPRVSNLRRRYAIAALAIAVPLVSAYALRSRWLPAASGVLPAGTHQRYLRAHDLVRHYYRPNALPTAIPMLETVVRDDPHFAAAFADLGRANFVEFWELRDTRFVEPARKASLDALAIDANQASAHVTLAMLYTQLGENAIAAQEVDAALRVDRMDAEAWVRARNCTADRAARTKWSRRFAKPWIWSPPTGGGPNNWAITSATRAGRIWRLWQTGMRCASRPIMPPRITISGWRCGPRGGWRKRARRSKKRSRWNRDITAIPTWVWFSATWATTAPQRLCSKRPSVLTPETTAHGDFWRISSQRRRQPCPDARNLP